MFADWSQRSLKNSIFGSSGPAFAGTGLFSVSASGRDDIREYRRTLNCFYSDLLMQELYPVDLPMVQADSRNREIQAGRVAAMRILQGKNGVSFL